MTWTWVWAAGALAMSGVVAGCESRPVQSSPPAALSGPEKNGSLVFAGSCAQCHPGGGAGMGPSLRRGDLTDAAVRTRVRQGKGFMPAFAPDRLDDAQLEELVAFLRTLRAPREQVSAPRAEP